MNNYYSFSYIHLSLRIFGTTTGNAGAVALTIIKAKISRKIIIKELSTFLKITTEKKWKKPPLRPQISIFPNKISKST